MHFKNGICSLVRLVLRNCWLNLAISYECEIAIDQWTPEIGKHPIDVRDVIGT